MTVLCATTKLFVRPNEIQEYTKAFPNTYTLSDLRSEDDEWVVKDWQTFRGSDDDVVVVCVESLDDFKYQAPYMYECVTRARKKLYIITDIRNTMLCDWFTKIQAKGKLRKFS